MHAGQASQLHRNTLEMEGRLAPAPSKKDARLSAANASQGTVGTFRSDMEAQSSEAHELPSMAELQDLGYEKISRPVLETADWQIHFCPVTG